MTAPDSGVDAARAHRAAPAARMGAYRAGWGPQPREFVVGGVRLPLVVHVPPGRPPRRGWPVLVAVHGAGEVGTDGWRQMDVGLGPWVERQPRDWPALVAFPQFPSAEPRRTDWLMGAIDYVLDTFPAHRQRVTAAGISMGGGMVLRSMARHPRRFRAVLAACPPWTEPVLGPKHGCSTWIVQGTRDPLVPATATRRLVAVLRDGGWPVRYTEVTGAAHEVWDLAFGDAGVRRWLLGGRMPTEGAGIEVEAAGVPALLRPGGFTRVE